MKKLIVILGLIISFAGYSQVSEITNGETGSSVRTKLNSIITSVNADNDGDATNEIQSISLTGNTISISDHISTIDLSAYLDNTDDQTLSIDSTDRVFTILIEDGNSITFEDTNTQIDTTSLSSRIDANVTDIDNVRDSIPDYETDPIVGVINGIVKADGMGNISAAVAGIDYLVTEADGSITNEGSLTVKAGTSTTSVISSNTSGSTDVTLIAGTNITLSESGNNITIAASGSSVPTFVYGETPTGTVNGTNGAFTTSNTPTSGTVRVYLNGLRQTPTTDYSVSTNTITFTTAPLTGDVIIVDYNY